MGVGVREGRDEYVKVGGQDLPEEGLLLGRQGLDEVPPVHRPI
jgi:hypothetical protein